MQHAAYIAFHYTSDDFPRKHLLAKARKLKKEGKTDTGLKKRVARLRVCSSTGGNKCSGNSGRSKCRVGAADVNSGR